MLGLSALMHTAAEPSTDDALPNLCGVASMIRGVGSNDDVLIAQDDVVADGEEVSECDYNVDSRAARMAIAVVSTAPCLVL